MGADELGDRCACVSIVATVLYSKLMTPRLLIECLLEINHRVISQDDPKNLGFDVIRDVVRKVARSD